MKQWFKCPSCGNKVDFIGEMDYLFDEDGEADFDPKHGIIFHTIICECGDSWTISMSGNEGVDSDEN